MRKYEMWKLLTGAALFTILSGVETQAAPVQWAAASGGNDHYYEFVPNEGVEWTEAKVAAESRVHNGQHGYLVTITSAAEDAFIDTNFAPLYIEAWAGGFQANIDTPNPSADWQWVTGEPWLFTDWASGEPNDFGGPEHLLSLGGDLNQINFQQKWNDDGIGTDQHLKAGYIVEYPIPEPATATILLTLTILFRAQPRY